MKLLTNLAPSGDDDQKRVLHRITSLSEWQTPANACRPFMKIAVIDTESTGFDPQYDELIEIAVAMIVIDDQGRVIAVESLRSGMQQPCRPIEPDISRITGITDEMVEGKRFVPQQIADHLAEADACLAFHAKFDRQHLEELVSEVGAMPWICAMEDVGWRALGFDGRAQGYLLTQAGMFNPTAHRAGDDVASLVNLLAHKCKDGRTVMAPSKVRRRSAGGSKLAIFRIACTRTRIGAVTADHITVSITSSCERRSTTPRSPGTANWSAAIRRSSRWTGSSATAPTGRGNR